MSGRLAGRVVATTREDDPTDPLGRKIRAEGGRVVNWPTMAFDGPTDEEALRATLARLSTFDWIAFTSARAVTAVADRIPPPAGRPAVASVGEATTATLESRGWKVDVTGDGGGALGLTGALSRTGSLEGLRILFPGADAALPLLGDELRARGARVVRSVVYRTRLAPPDPERVRRDLARGVDVVTFASPSAVRSLARALGDDPAAALAGCGVAAIGPTTARALEKAGVQGAALAPTATFDGLVEACVIVTERSRAS